MSALRGLKILKQRIAEQSLERPRRQIVDGFKLPMSREERRCIDEVNGLNSAPDFFRQPIINLTWMSHCLGQHGGVTSLAILAGALKLL